MNYRQTDKIELLWITFYCLLCWPTAIAGAILFALFAYQIVPIISSHINQLIILLQL